MDLPTFTMDKKTAEARLAAYEGLLDEQRTAEDEQIKRGYRSAAKGFPVLRLSETIASGGYFDSGLPKIAIARADAKLCVVERESNWRSSPEHDFVFCDDEWHENRGALIGQHTVKVTVPFIEPRATAMARRMSTGQTIVPIIPPELRPKPRRMRGFHILFEVEEWKPLRRRGGAVPGDPALLRHIGGDLWSVVGVWDLTDLERAVLSGRA
jgi:hypothetical protein